jgi:hypothetical protein
MDEKTPQYDSLGQKIKTIHTYTSDMADAVRINEASVIKIALAEKEKREQEAIYAEANDTKGSKFMLVFGGIVLIALSIFGWYFLSKKNEVANTPQQTKKDIEAFISYDDKAYIDVTENKNQGDLSKSIKIESDKSGKAGSIKALFLTENVNKAPQLLSLKNLLFLMDTQAPSALVRTLDDQYMIGTYTERSTDGQTTESTPKTHLFLVFKAKDYNQAYAAMLTWEKTMLRDLFVLFNVDLGKDGEALFDKPWGDVLINNQNARILYDRNGKEILYYILTNKNNFIITDNQETIKEVSARLLVKGTKPL